MDILIGRCGIACEYCKKYDNVCLGCEEENREKHTCIIYNCAEKKNTYCTQCPEAPCNFMRSISKAYCPVYSDLEIPGSKRSSYP